MPTLRPPGMPRFSGSSTVRTPSGTSGSGEPLPTTTTSTAVAVLLGDRVQQGAQLLGAVAHGDDRPRRAFMRAHSLQPAGGEDGHQVQQGLQDRDAGQHGDAEPGEEQVAPDLVQRSPATRISSDASMPRTSRWNFSAAAALRASAMPEERGSDAASLTGGRPPWWRATPTRSVSALIRIGAERGERAEEGPQPVDPPGAPQVGGAQAEADQHRGVAQVGADAVQVDARRARTASSSGRPRRRRSRAAGRAGPSPRRARRPRSPAPAGPGPRGRRTTVIR